MFNRLTNLNAGDVLGILLSGAIFLGSGSLLVNIIYNVDTSPAWWVSLLQNFSTELLGAFFTFLLINLVLGDRQRREDEQKQSQQLKQRLIIQMGSKDNAIALQAMHELRAYGWLMDGSLYGAFLSGANLQGAELDHVPLQGVELNEADLERGNLRRANLEGANLRKVNLRWARLEEANLKRANLRDAILEKANLDGVDMRGARLWFAFLHGTQLQYAYLQGANLSQVNMQEANFRYTNLKGATLDGADLQGVDLGGANLEGASFKSAILGTETILPDESKWTSDTDLARFTDPTHPQFWRVELPEFGGLSPHLIDDDPIE